MSDSGGGFGLKKVPCGRVEELVRGGVLVRRGVRHVDRDHRISKNIARNEARSVVERTGADQ
jgi:hypothetical protein